MAIICRIRFARGHCAHYQKWDLDRWCIRWRVIGCDVCQRWLGERNQIQLYGLVYRSSLDRGPSELALLAAHGQELQGMSLQSYLFFGTANRLYQHVRELPSSNGDCRFLVFDFWECHRD